MATDVEEEVTDKTLDQGLEDTIRNTLKDINEREPETTEIVAEPVVEAPKVERARDETGKFIESKVSATPEKADTPKAQAAPASDQVVVETPAEVATNAPAIDINRAPSSWKPAAKAAWSTLPEPVRAEIYRREGDYHVGLKDIKANADFGQTVQRVVDPYRMIIEAEGGTPERAIGDLLRTAALFRTGSKDQKLAAIFDIDKKFNGGLSEYVQNEFNRLYALQTGKQPAQQPQQQAPYRDERVDKLLEAQERTERERQQRESQAASQATERFLSAKDDKGQPLYPFVDNVLDDMSERVAGIRRSNPALSAEEVFKQAYEAAVWANPETRAVLISQQQATANQPTEKLQKVEAARRASAVNLPKRGGLPASQSVAAFGTAEADEQMRETYRRLTAN